MLFRVTAEAIQTYQGCLRSIKQPVGQSHQEAQSVNSPGVRVPQRCRHCREKPQSALHPGTATERPMGRAGGAASAGRHPPGHLRPGSRTCRADRAVSQASTGGVRVGFDGWSSCNLGHLEPQDRAINQPKGGSHALKPLAATHVQADQRRTPSHPMPTFMLLKEPPTRKLSAYARRSDVWTAFWSFVVRAEKVWCRFCGTFCALVDAMLL